MYQIAIDGPSGAGKSTIAKLLAKKLRIAYLDTGAMYRAVALYTIRRGIDPERAGAVVQALDSIELNVLYIDGKQITILNGEDVSLAIRQHEVSAAASAVSAIPAVRERLVRDQRELAARQSFVLDGRDIGTVVLPQAKYKFFLTAAVEVRARRRAEELQASGQAVNFDQICKDIKTRDEHDMNRACSPLRAADDAITIDSSDLTVEEVLIAMMSHIREEIG